jgi:hypothetical protein
VGRISWTFIGISFLFMKVSTRGVDNETCLPPEGKTARHIAVSHSGTTRAFASHFTNWNEQT